MSRIIWSLFAVLCWASMTPLLAEETKLAAPPAKVEVADGDTIVFLGDSITHQCLYTQYVEDYFFTRFPKQRVKFHNSGVGGDRCSDALIRFDRDVAHYKPRYVTILLGMNDFGGQGYNEETFQTYKNDMDKLLVKIKEIGAQPILITPTMYDARASRANKGRAAPPFVALHNSVLAFYGAYLREVAVENGYPFVDMWGPLNQLTLESRKQEPAFTMIRDAVHPDAPGQAVMAFSVISDLGWQRGVSRISIARGPDHTPQAKATGGKLTDVKYATDSVEFTFASDALPLVLPAEAKIGVDLTRMGHRLSQEFLDVQGLPAGRYQLLIDGQPVGAYTHDALGRHIELQSVDKAPQYQQALAVAMLNKQRNDEAMRPIRNLWREKKIHRRAQETVKLNPNDEKARGQLEQLDKSMATFDSRLQDLEAKVKEFDNGIYQLNQPQPHKYQLVRLAK